jgi:hypothetical protein
MPSTSSSFYVQITTAMGDTTYTVLSQQSLVGLQQSEDYTAEFTEDEDEEN